MLLELKVLREVEVDKVEQVLKGRKVSEVPKEERVQMVQLDLQELLEHKGF